MKWKHPALVKVYEAIGAVADDRVEVSGNTAKVFSSSRNKFYDISYDPKNNAIMSNDNGSYWKGYLGYPAISFLMKINVLPYDEVVGRLLQDIAWKDINQQFNNDFDLAMAFIFSYMTEKNVEKIKKFAEKVHGEVIKLDLNKLGKRVKPPEGY